MFKEFHVQVEGRDTARIYGQLPGIKCIRRYNKILRVGEWLRISQDQTAAVDALSDRGVRVRVHETTRLISWHTVHDLNREVWAT